MLNEDHKEISSGKKKDDEGYMAKVELDSIERSIKNLRKVIKNKNTQLPAWVQSKITRAADYINTASEYLQSNETVEEESKSFEINPKDIKASQKAKKIRTLVTQGSTEGERKAARNKVKGPSLPKGSISTGVINAEYIPSLVEKILGEEKCGKGMYWCNTDKVCKPLPSGFKIHGQKKTPTEVGIEKPVSEEQNCNHTEKGKNCPIHGKNNCSVKEEKDPKGPVKSYKSPKEIAQKHKVSIEQIQRQLEMGIKVEGEHTSNKTSARITALQHLDEVPDYYTKLKKVEKVSESATRIKSETGNVISVTLSWRGKYHSVKMFFPQTKFPSRRDVSIEINKIYPGSRVISYFNSELPVGEPLIKVYGGSPAKVGPTKNYIKPMGEEVELLESKKSNMPCNKPKAQAHGSGEQGKSHVVKACEGGKEKLIRFGQVGVKGSPKKEGESREYANRRKRFKSRHAKNIAKGKMSAAYWANKVKW